MGIKGTKEERVSGDLIIVFLQMTMCISCQPGSHAISEGKPVSLAGAKRKSRISTSPIISTTKVIKLEHFSQVVKSKAGNLAKEHKLSEELAIWTTHYKSGLVETSDFLSYYSERKVESSCSWWYVAIFCSGGVLGAGAGWRSPGSTDRSWPIQNSIWRKDERHHKLQGMW